MLAAILCFPVGAAEYYKLEGVKRIDDNLYRSAKILIETRFCFHFTFGETAILKYEGPAEFSGSTIIWNDNTTCQVNKVISTD